MNTQPDMLRRCEADRPTNHSLRYLTQLRPHLIKRDNFLVDSYVHQSMIELLEFDPEEILGGYTRSFYSLEGHYENLWKYDKPVYPKPVDPLLDRALDITSEIFRLDEPVDSISWDCLRDVPFISSSSAGWGYKGKKGDFNNHQIAIRRAVGSLNAWLYGYRSDGTPFRYAPDLAFTRTQLGSIYNPKVRHVWGTAFENIILEGMTASPLIRAYEEKGDPIPIGIHIYKRLPSIIQTTLYSNQEKRTGIGTDLKSFDSCAQPWIIDEAFNILRQNIRFHDPMEEYAFLYSQYHFKRRPVVMPDGRMWLKFIGIPSGSYFTQLIGSIINHIITTYAQLSVYGRHFKTWCLGDDSIFGIPVDLDHDPDVTRFVAPMTSLGFVLHPEKTIKSQHPDDLEYLGHTARGTKVSRELLTTLRLALYPEYPVDGPAVSLSRIRGLVLDSGLNSWPIIQLNDYMTAKYGRDPLFDQLEYPPEDRNWMHSVVGHSFRPTDVDMIKAWTFT